MHKSVWDNFDLFSNVVHSPTFMRKLLPSLCAGMLLVCGAGSVWAEMITIVTPGGVIPVMLTHAGPSGQLVEPDAPQTSGFRPPAIFAAPLPTGSGARALGQARAFTAVADDASAASWNPAGLTQLEYPEVSVVYRFSSREDGHHSTTRELVSDCDRYSNHELNYASAVYPFLLNGQNAVFSLNYQEAYDFTQTFSAKFSGQAQWGVSSLIEQTFNSTTNWQQNDYVNQNLTVVRDVTTLAESRVDQILSSSLLSEIEFVQRGTIDAISPAFAMELNPRLSVGAAVNFYTDGASRGNAIRSTLVADYSGFSDSSAEVTETLSSSSMFYVDGVLYIGPPWAPEEEHVSDTYGPYMHSDTNTYVQQVTYLADGYYREENRTEQFYGVNATLGVLWVASDRLTLGAAIDLPWTGRGRQTKQMFHQSTTFNSNGVQVAEGVYSETQRRDVQYTFPLYWSLGALWRWNDRFYSSMDVSCTYWSDFSYKAEGEVRMNPLNGEPSSGSGIDDCWSVRFGNEYLCVLSWTEIPLRGGFFWEQRPAVGAPDQYWGVSLGSGLSLGKEPGRFILDVAYTFERGEGVMGSLLPEQGMTSDSEKHQIFVSAIWHF